MNKRILFFFSFSFILLILSISFHKDFFRLRERRLQNLEKDSKDHHFVLIIPAYNCSEVIGKIFQSLEKQTYKNFRVIFIDDGSNDSTYEKAVELLPPSMEKKFILRKHAKRKGSIECMYEEAQKCKDEEIIVFFEGDSWFKNADTLETFNTCYKRYDIWVAYAQHANYKTNKKGKCRDITSANIFSRSMRRKCWHHAKLKSFYAALFKKVPLNHFFFRGRFVHEEMDSAYMFSIMEMAGKHVAFFPETHLLYIKSSLKNIDRPSFRSPFKCYREITRRKPLKPLEKLALYPSVQNKKADLLIFSYDRPLQLYALLESIDKNMDNLQEIAILYRTSSPSFEKGYINVQKNFPHIRFYSQNLSKSLRDFKHLTLQIVDAFSTEHVIFSVDDMIVKQKVDLSEAIDVIEKTQAYFFSLRLGTHLKFCYMGEFDQRVPQNIKVTPHIIGWQIDAARGDWNYYPSVDMTMFSLEHVRSIFPNILFNDPNELEAAWEKYYRKIQKVQMRREIGLCYIESKAVNIPLNIVSALNNKSMNLYSKDELLEKFSKGLKIDIEPLQNSLNASVHIELDPTFIERKVN